MGKGLLGATRREEAVVSTTLTPAELARRARAAAHVRISETDAYTYLEEWRQAGIAREVRPGAWQLTERGRAMFSGWSAGIDVDDDQAAA